VRARRTLVACAVLLAALAACAAPENAQPMCRSVPPTVLMAESVPSATVVPCVKQLPAGWAFDTFTADETASSFTLQQQSDAASLEVSFVPECAPPSGAATGASPGRTYRSVQDAGATVVWTSMLTGGCSVATLRYPGRIPAEDASAIRRALGTIPREELVPSVVAPNPVGA
jgi:hypothetical protein